ncbi:hypothetical protein PMX66_02530 [Collinsella aerofaciens]|uniref:hypothetical protein n=1 Tax=Collinsella aerofaciens TaxID=74426 RepID=UPI001106508F|nr:hypothetical protein [Collinsella aerofaciens]MDB1875172.1 hypothetical protein [Collinsella aerofaciens]MDB1877021.1 hypothetical protein [Collinsella aerofaciens]
MVTREAIVRAANRYDTVMAWAFRRALGIARRAGKRKGSGAGKAVERLRYAGLEECMANRGRSPEER